MTIGTTVPRATLNCDGVTKVFPVPIQAYQAGDFLVLLTAPAAAGGASTQLNLNADYTLAASSTDQPPKWTLTTLAAAAYAAGYTIQAILNPAENQTAQFVQGQAFPSLSVQTALDRVTQMVQRLTDQIGRAIIAPDGDVSPLMQLANAATRANKQPLFDANGNLTLGVLSAVPITTALLASFLALSQTPAEAGALVVPANVAYLPGWTPRYGAATANVDNTAALVAAVAQGAQPGGAPVYSPAGNYNFASVAAASVCAIPGAGNVTIQGAGKTLTQFTITGANDTNGFFTGTNLSNIHITDIGFVGNNKATGFSDGGAINFSLTSAATQQVGNYHIERCAFKNFQATYWLAFFASGAAVQNFGMQTLRVKDCDFTSLTGNALNGASILYPAHCIAILGGYTPAATFKDVEISGCTADCTFIKGFFYNWGGSLHVSVHDCTIKNVGSSAQLSNDSGCYALAAYQAQHYVIQGITNAASAVVTANGHTFSNGDYVTFGQIVDAGYNSGVPSVAGSLMAALNNVTVGPISNVGANVFTIPVNTSALAAYASGGSVSNLTTPDLCYFTNNTVDGVRDCGVYMASTYRIWLSNCTFIGQTSTADGTIPKGAIALNQDIRPVVDDCKIFACAIGVSIVPALGVSVSINDTRISAIPTNGVGFKIAPTGTGCVGEVIIDGYRLDTTATGVTALILYSNSTIGVASFKMKNFTWEGMQTGLNQFSNNATVPALGDVTITNGEVVGFSNYGFLWNGASNAGTRATFDQITFERPVAGAVMFNAANSTGLMLGTITFKDMTAGAGYAWNGTGSQGGLYAFRYINVAIANRFSGGASELGVIAPAFNGTDNLFIADLNPTELVQAIGANNVKYMRLGWGWDRVNAAWKEERALTGN